MTPAPPPALRDWPTDLLREHDMVVTKGAIRVRGRSHALTYVATVEAESREPRAFPSVALLCLGAMTIPVTLGPGRGWTVGIPVALMLLAGARLLTAATTFCVVLRSAGKRVTLFESEDQRLVIALTAALNAALHDA